MPDVNIAFTAKDGLCPYFILGDVKYYIQDCKINDEWKYIFCSKKQGFCKKTFKNHPQEVIERYFRINGITKYKRYLRVPYAYYKLSGKLFGYKLCENEITVQYQVKEIAGYYDNYKDCLDYAKKYITDNFIDTQMNLFE